MTRVAIIVALVLAAGCGGRDAVNTPCGFRCGPAGACPTDYTCFADGRCHSNDSSPYLSCAIDGGIDAPDPAPVIVDVYPRPGTFNLPTDVTISVLFDEDVSGVSRDTFKLRRNSVFDVVLPATVSYDAVEHVATLDPAQPLVDGTQYYASIDGAILGRTGMAVQPLAWEFSTTPDIEPPTVVMMVPANGATGVSVDTPILAKFSEQVSGVTASTFFMVGPSGTLFGAIGYVSPTTTRLFPGTLAPNTSYGVTLMGPIQDFAGNPLLSAPVLWSFTTGPDTAPPTISACNVCGGETDIAPGQLIVVRFSEPMIGVSPASISLDQAGTPVPATVSYVSSTSSVELSPTALLAPGTTYRLTITPAITDQSGNPVVPAVLSWTFSTSP